MWRSDILFDLDLTSKGSESGKCENDEGDLSDWSDLGESFSDRNDTWLAVEEDEGGNLHISSIEEIDTDQNVSDEKTEIDEEFGVEIIPIEDGNAWDVLTQDYSVLTVKDKSYSQKLNQRTRAESLAIGVSGAVIAAVLSPSAAVTSFLLLNAADLIKLGTKGRLSKLTFEQRDTSMARLVRSLALKNGKASAVTFAATTATKWMFVGSTSLLPLLILDQMSVLSLVGIELSALDLVEKAIVGAACSVSSQVVLGPKKQQYKHSKPKKKVRVKKVLLDGVSGAAKGLIAPVISSPVAEKCVMEACAASSKLMR